MIVLSQNANTISMILIVSFESNTAMERKNLVTSGFPHESKNVFEGLTLYRPTHMRMNRLLYRIVQSRSSLKFKGPDHGEKTQKCNTLTQTSHNKPFHSQFAGLWPSHAPYKSVHMACLKRCGALYVVKTKGVQRTGVQWRRVSPMDLAKQPGMAPSFW